MASLDGRHHPRRPRASVVSCAHVSRCAIRLPPRAIRKSPLRWYLDCHWWTGGEGRAPMQNTLPLLHNRRVYASRNVDETAAFMAAKEFGLDLPPREASSF